MVNFNEIFDDQYQFSLKQVEYTRLEPPVMPQGLQMKIEDRLTTNVVDRRLEAVFCREILFDPNSLFRMCICFGFTLTFKPDYEINDAVNWGEELIRHDNPYLSNIISRASWLIGSITSSYGQNPLVTPPSFMN